MRAVAYVRESTARQAEERYSPDAQRRAIEKFAEEKGHTLIGEYFDVMSGTKEQRPEWQRLMEAAVRHEFQAVLVFHSTRWGRDWRVTPYYTKKLIDLGVVVIFLDISAEPGSEEAEVMEWANSFVASQYSRMLSRFTKAGLQEKHRQGGHVGAIPVGYDRESGGTLVANDDAKAVRKAFRSYATGRYGVRDIARQLADAGVRTRLKSPLSVSGVMKMFWNRTYLGYVKRAGEEIGGRHKSLVSQDTFNAVQRQFKLRKRSESRPRKYRVYVLSGLLECAACGSHWRGRADYDKEQELVKRYYCYGSGGMGCPSSKRGATAEDLEVQVKVLVVDRLVFGHEDRDKLLAAIRKEQPNRQREYQRISARLQRVKDLFEMNDIDREEYTAKRDLLAAELAAVQPTEIPTQVTEVLDVVENLDKWWDDFEPRAKQTALRFVVESLVVDNGTITAVKLQPSVVPIANALFVALGPEHVKAIAADSTSRDSLTHLTCTL